MNQRLAYVDMMRGIAILLVVAAHLIQTNVNGGAYTKAFMFINSFHMPLFFAISGYIAQKVYMPLEGAKDLLFFIKKKAIALLIPLFVWDLIVYKLFLSSTWEWPTYDSFIHEINHPRLWFLLTLFLIFVGYSIFSFTGKKWNAGRKIYKDIVLLSLILILYCFYYVANLRVVQVALYSIPFYMGVFIAKYKNLEKFVLNEYILATSFVVFVLLVGHWDMWSGSYKDDIIKNIIDPCAFVVLLNGCMKMEKWKMSHAICQWGRYSLEIYVAHWTMLSIFGRGIEVVNINQIWLFLLAVVVSLPIIYTCIGLSKIVETTRVARMVLYGKTR